MRIVPLLLAVVLAGCGGAAKPHRVNVWAPTQGTIDTMLVAAKRWNQSGANVQITVVRYRKDADVTVVRDDAELRRLCGRLCFGLTHGNQLFLRESLAELTPLSVWIGVHELGHVLGLAHDTTHACTVMAPHWFDTKCAPSGSTRKGSVYDPRCAPAPVDVEAAIKLYGGSVRHRDPYCSGT